MLHLFPHWNWKGKEGEVIPVLCYTNCDTVELFLNGKSFGVQGYWFPRSGMEEQLQQLPGSERGAPHHGGPALGLDGAYQPGTLKAVGTKDGKVVATQEISTTGETACSRPLRWTARPSRPTAGTWLTSPSRSWTPRAGWCRSRTMRSPSRSRARARSSVWTTETR